MLPDEASESLARVEDLLVEACRAAMRGEPFLYPGAVRALSHALLGEVVPHCPEVF